MTEHNTHQAGRARRWATRVAGVAAPGLVVAVAAGPAGAAVPSVGNTQPPGTQGLDTILGWGGWIVGFLGVAGILIVASMMVIQHKRGEGGEHIGKLGMVLGGLVIASGASLLAGAVYT